MMRQKRIRVSKVPICSRVVVIMVHMLEGVLSWFCYFCVRAVGASAMRHNLVLGVNTKWAPIRVVVLLRTLEGSVQ